MSQIDWDKAAQQKSVLEPGGDQRGYIAGKNGPEPIEFFTPFPEIGGLLGGIGGALLTKNPAGARVGQTAGQAFMRTLIPSLAGSTAGTVIGLGAEEALQGTTANRAMSALVENAAWDVGGNLAFSLGGKAVRLGKEALDSLGITRAGTFDDARLAAQKYLEARDATLTRGQLTGGVKDKFLEGMAASGTGADIFAKQQEGVAKAISTGTKEVLDSLDTSDAFKAALRADEPLSRAAGENFQFLIDTSRTAFKDTYRPFYESLSKDYGVLVDMRPLKEKAKQEIMQASRIKGAGASSERTAVLNDILKQEDLIEFGAAHDLRSSLSAAAEDLKVPGAGTTTKGAAYSQYSSELNKQMDNIIDASANKIGKDLLVKYRQTQRAYKQGQEGLFNATINQAMKESPSKVGAYLFDLAETGKSTDLMKAVAEVDTYAKANKDASAKVLNDFKYGFLENAMSTPEKVVKLSDQLSENPEMRRAFYKIFKTESAPVKEILNAAKIGLDNLPGESKTYMRNKAVLAGGQALTLGLGYIALPNELTDKINLPETLATGAVFVLTPRLIAKAATNKETMSALIDLQKASKNPKFAGAAAAKLADRLNAAGIIDNEYINEVNTFFGSPEARETSVPESMTPSTQPINWDSFTE